MRGGREKKKKTGVGYSVRPDLPYLRRSGFCSFWRRAKKTQSIVEYAIAFVMVVIGIIGISFLPKVREIFDKHFDQVLEEMGVK